MKPDEVPFQRWAKKLYDERIASEGKDDPEGYCLPSGVPRTNPYPYQIVQTPGRVVFLYEGNIHSFRQVLLGKKRPIRRNSTRAGSANRSGIGRATRWWWIPSG